MLVTCRQKNNNLGSGEIGQSSIWFWLEKWSLVVQNQEPSKKNLKDNRNTFVLPRHISKVQDYSSNFILEVSWAQTYHYA